MILGFAEDFTSSVILDSELTSVPESGMYFNSGVHESITIDNLLHFLPNLEFTFAVYVAGTTYRKFEDSRKRTDIVTSGGKTYQSIAASNIGNDPASSPAFWLETNLDSLRLKTFIFKVQDKVLSELNLTKRLVDSQYLYSVGDVIKDTPVLLSGDFAGMAFEPKGSDYVAIKINEISLQAPVAGPVDLFVINQGVLVDTIPLTTNLEGRLEFQSVNNKILLGKGRWILAFASQSVFTNQSFIDPLKFKGFTAYTVTGTGAIAESAIYTINAIGNGLNFNISAFLDASTYVTQNLVYFANFTQATFELEALNMYLANANNRSNRKQRIQMSDNLLLSETKDLTINSIAKKFQRERKQAVKQLEKTFDRELSEDESGIEIETGSV